MKRITGIAAAALLCAAGAFAALSPERQEWGKGPVQFLMTDEERAQWSQLQTDAQADEFIALFWARRDPTPGTPRNEYREQFNERVTAADKQLSTKTLRGALSDQGKILIIFGAPTRATRNQGNNTGTFRNQARSDTEDSTVSQSIWTYDGDIAQKLFATPRAELQFVDRMNNGEFHIIPGRVDVLASQKRAIAASITQPNLTKAPTVQTVTVPMAQPAAPAPGVLKTASLETAITDAKAGKVATKGADVEYAEFLAPTGDYYVPIGLYVPPSANMTAEDADTFFGVVEDATGKRVDAFEVPAKGMPSKNSFFFDHTSTLPSGTYTATLGLAKAGVPVLIASGPVTTSALAKEAVGTSRLVLSDIIETIDAAPVKSPFAFGKLKIVPRVQFTNKDELGYFIELHNPGIDPATNQPKVQAKLDLIQPSGPPISAPLQDVGVLPLSGATGPGEYAVISGVPLGELKNPLKPGEYTLRVKIVDTVTKKSYTVEQKFKIVG